MSYTNQNPFEIDTTPEGERRREIALMERQLEVLQFELNREREKLKRATEALWWLRPSGCDWPRHVQSKRCEESGRDNETSWCASCRRRNRIDQALAFVNQKNSRGVG